MTARRMSIPEFIRECEAIGHEYRLNIWRGVPTGYRVSFPMDGDLVAASERHQELCEAAGMYDGARGREVFDYLLSQWASA